MNNEAFDLLMWARGPGFDIALIIFLGGVVLRLVEIIILGRKKDMSTPKGQPVAQGFKTIFSRTFPREGLVKFAPITYIGGYISHRLLYRVLLLRTAHRTVHGCLRHFLARCRSCDRGKLNGVGTARHHRAVLLAYGGPGSPCHHHV